VPKGQGKDGKAESGIKSSLSLPALGERNQKNIRRDYPGEASPRSCTLLDCCNKKEKTFRGGHRGRGEGGRSPQNGVC